MNFIVSYFNLFQKIFDFIFALTNKCCDFYSGDKELMQLLFFDAKITHAIYNKTWTPTSKFEYVTFNEY